TAFWPPTMTQVAPGGTTATCEYAGLLKREGARGKSTVMIHHLEPWLAWSKGGRRRRSRTRASPREDRRSGQRRWPSTPNRKGAGALASAGAGMAPTRGDQSVTSTT